ncbi:MAG: serine hydrolase [Coprothermobacterota bacterium]|nr:serine hydrolase [Coprothermobacterota bacterium]
MKVTSRFLIVCFLLLAFLLAGCSGSPSSSPAPLTYSATIAEGRAALQKALEETGAASMSVALVDGDQVVWSEAFGVAEKSTGQAASTDTLYCIGSVSKMLATVSVMKLAEQGKVKLDDPLVKYLPDFRMLSPEYRDITVRMLINHSSGFGGSDYRNAFLSAPYSGYGEQVQAALKEERLKFDPGYLNVYCNDGFTMVEILVKALTGQSYPDFVRQEILIPLGMSHSLYPQKLEDLLPGTYAESYADGQLVTPEFVSVYASGGLYSTPSDMGRLAMMLMNGGSLGATRMLSPASVAEMGTDQTIGTFNPLPTDLVRYGLGWDTVTQPGMMAVGIEGWQKSGGTSAYHTEFLVLPKEHLAAVVLTDGSGGAKALSVAEQILLRALIERGKLSAMPAPQPPMTLAEVTPSETDQEAISGLYAANLKLCRVSFAPDHSLTIESASCGVWNRKVKNFKLRADGWYTSDENPTLSYTPVIGDGRRYLAARTTYGYGHYLITVLLAEKLFAKPQMTPAWQERAGKTYLNANVSMYDRTMMGSSADPRFTLIAMPDLPGYLFTPSMDVVDASVDDVLARMFLLIPQDSGRDLNDIAVVARGGEEWLRQGSTLFRPLASVPTLAAGSSTVTIGSEGFNEWRTLPATSSVSIDGASEWRLYDADFKQIASGPGSGSAVLPGSGTAAYLMLFGSPGATISLNLALE